ncbi:hypothetical protein TNCV_3892271 [Trichonephila clavipes]|nr:hypothetical protein TNCV_3892271 [Trichonephila clavipes]
MVRVSHLSSPSTKLTRGVRLDGYRVPPCCEGTIHLQTSMPSPGLEPKPYRHRRWNIRFRPIPFRFGELVGGGTWSCIALDVLWGSQVMPGVIPVGTKAQRNTGTKVGTNTDTTLP